MILPFRGTRILMIFMIFPLRVLALIFDEFGHRFGVHFGTRLVANSMFLGDRSFELDFH